MATRLNAVTPRSYIDQSGETRTAFTNIGSAFETKNGGWAIRLDALPVPSIGRNGNLETTILLMPPKDDDRPPARQQERRGTAPSFDSSGDDIPF